MNVYSSKDGSGDRPSRFDEGGAREFGNMDGVVFVLGVNCSELVESVKAVYGASFDVEGYLQRFFDLEIHLPSPDREAFIETQLKAIRLNACSLEHKTNTRLVAITVDVISGWMGLRR